MLQNAGGTAGHESDSDSNEGITLNQLLALLRRNPQAIPGNALAQLRQAMRAAGAQGSEEEDNDEEEEEEESEEEARAAGPQMNMAQVADEMDEVEKEKDRGNELFRSNQWYSIDPSGLLTLSGTKHESATLWRYSDWATSPRRHQQHGSCALVSKACASSRC